MIWFSGELRGAVSPPQRGMSITAGTYQQWEVSDDPAGEENSEMVGPFARIATTHRFAWLQEARLVSQAHRNWKLPREDSNLGPGG
jgi:hypothetical protein